MKSTPKVNGTGVINQAARSTRKAMELEIKIWIMKSPLEKDADKPEQGEQTKAKNAYCTDIAPISSEDSTAISQSNNYRLIRTKDLQHSIAHHFVSPLLASEILILRLLPPLEEKPRNVPVMLTPFILVIIVNAPTDASVAK